MQATLKMERVLLALDSIRVGDGIRVRSAQTSFLGRVVKINRVTFVLSSAVWGNPVEYTARKTDCVDGPVDRDGKTMEITK